MKKRMVIALCCVTAFLLFGCMDETAVESQTGSDADVTAASEEQNIENEEETVGEDVREPVSEEVSEHAVTENKDIVSEEPSIEEEIIEDSPITLMDTILFAQRSVNVRSGPGTDYEKLGTLSTNQEVTVTGQDKESGWYQIDYNATTAFVSDSYLGENKVVVTTPTNTTVVNSGSVPAANNTQTAGSTVQNMSPAPSDSSAGSADTSSSGSGNGWFDGGDMQNALQFGQQFDMY